MTTQFLATLQGELVDLGTLIQNKTIHTVEMPVTNPALQKYTANFNGRVKIGTNDLSVEMNGVALNGSQRYTFGPSQQPLFVAACNAPSAGVGNSLIFSTNRTTWYGLGITTFNVIGCGVCYNGKIWVAFGGSASIAYSYDGKMWNNVTPTIFGTQGYHAVWNGTMFVAGGQGPSQGTGNTLAYSYDGINWVGLGVSVCAYNVHQIGWNGNIWLAVGLATSNTAQIAYSTNGINWAASTNSGSVFANSCFGIAWNGSTWIGVGSITNTIGYSINGITWTAVPSSTSFIPGFGSTIAWNGSIWVAGAAYGSIATTNDPLGRTGWSLQTVKPISSYVEYIKWDGKVFIAIGQGAGANTLAYSANGLNWIGLGFNVKTSTGGQGLIEFNSLRPHSITFPRYMLIATGAITAGGAIAISYDGLTWTLINLSATIFGTDFLRVKYNGKIWVGTGYSGNTMTYSYNGVNWNAPNYSYFGTLGFGLEWNGTIWVVGGRGSTSVYIIYYSYDGIMWVPSLAVNVIFNGAGGVTAIKWNGKMFIAGGVGITTSDSIAYSYNGINWTSINQIIFTSSLRDVTSNGTIWVAVGSGTNTIAYSYNGINWTGLGSIIFSTAGQGVEWNGTMFVAVGQGVTTNIAYSYTGIQWTPVTISTDFFGINWDGTRWQASGSSTTSAYSYNGITWTTYTNVFTGGGGRACFSTYNINPIPYIQQPAIAVGSGRNSLAYSDDGITWLGLGTTIFSQEACDVAWNGVMWIAMGIGGNSIAYSKDGIYWTGLGTSIFTSGSAIAWNGNIWLASGAGTNTLAWSQNGINWTGLGRPVFSTVGYGIAWNGTAWVAMGQGSNTIAYSGDGISWTGIGTSTFSTSGSDIATNGIYWVATGQGTNSLAYTTTLNGSTGWTAVTSMNTTFNTGGSGIAWNGSTWVATGTGTSHTIAYSTNVTTWTGAGKTTFTTQGIGVCWNGVRFIATGQGGNSIAYSPNGINWYRALNNFSNTSTTNIFTNYGNCVASNPTVGVPVVESQMVLNPAINGQSTLDIVADAYYQPGFSNVSVKIEQNNLY